ncbi:MAG TPA: ATP-binding protein, partial [Nitrospira sp.]
MAKADRFLATPRSAKEYSRLRDDLLEDNASLLNVSNEVVVLLTKHSEARVTRLIGWEVIAVFLIVAVASIRTWQFVQTENALARSQSMVMDALRQRDAVKSSLLSSVSHELRTPLTAIKTMLFNLHEESVTQAATVRMEFLKSIDEELDYLNRLVGNLLDMSRIEAGTLKPSREWHLLDELIEVSIRRVGQRLERRSLHIDLSQDLPPIYVDGMEIQQVLVNLLDNAVKFSAEDSPISIQAGRHGDKITVQVTNQGEGIPHDELNRIFDRFYRVSARTISAVPGTGLGLAICKSIVEAHGGLIEARSISGQETTVSFSIPVMEGVPNHQRETTHA